MPARRSKELNRPVVVPNSTATRVIGVDQTWSKSSWRVKRCSIGFEQWWQIQFRQDISILRGPRVSGCSARGKISMRGR